MTIAKETDKLIKKLNLVRIHEVPPLFGLNRSYIGKWTIAKSIPLNAFKLCGVLVAPLEEVNRFVLARGFSDKPLTMDQFSSLVDGE